MDTPTPSEPVKMPVEELHTATPTPAPSPAPAPAPIITTPSYKKYVIPVSIALGALLIIGAAAYYFYAQPSAEILPPEEQNTLSNGITTPSPEDQQNLDELNTVVNDIQDSLNPSEENLYIQAAFDELTTGPYKVDTTTTPSETPTKVYR